MICPNVTAIKSWLVLDTVTLGYSVMIPSPLTESVFKLLNNLHCNWMPALWKISEVKSTVFHLYPHKNNDVEIPNKLLNMVVDCENHSTGCTWKTIETNTVVYHKKITHRIKVLLQKTISVQQVPPNIGQTRQLWFPSGIEKQ